MWSNLSDKALKQSFHTRADMPGIPDDLCIGIALISSRSSGAVIRLRLKIGVIEGWLTVAWYC